MQIVRRGQSPADRAWSPRTSEEPPPAITELSRALSEGRPGGLQLFEKLTGNERLWWRCCRDAVQIQPSWLLHPDHDRALRLIGESELVASSGAVSRAVEAVDLTCGALALAAGAVSSATQLGELVARAAACWDGSPAVLTAGASFAPQTAAASVAPRLREHVRKVLACLENVSTDGGQAMAAICALLLAAGRPDTGRVVRVPVVFARPGEKQASSSGVAGTLELREFPPGPSGLFPDPRGLRSRRADPAFNTGLGLAWQFAAGADRGGRCVLWRLSLDAGVPDYAIDGGSLGAAFAVALRELLRKPRGSRPSLLSAPRAFFIGLRPKCAITGVLAAQRPPAYDQLTSRTAHGPWLDEVGGMDAKLEAASAKGLRLVAPTANRAAAQPRAAAPVDWAETIHQADRYARRVRPVRTAIAGTGLVLTALAVSLATITTVAIGQRSTITSAHDVTASNTLADQSEATRGTDPVLARLEAAAAWRLNPSPLADYAMLRAAASPWTAVLNSHTVNQQHSIAISPGGTLLAAGTSGGTQLWNLTTRTLITTLPASGFRNDYGIPSTPGPVNSVAFSPSGTLLAAGTYAGTQLWNLTTRKLITTLPAGPAVSILNSTDADVVNSVAFSSDGTLLAAGIAKPEANAPDGGIQLWDVTTRKLITTLPAGSAYSVHAVAFSSGGTLLAAGIAKPITAAEPDGGIQLWDVSTRKLVTTLPSGNGSYDDAVAFSPDGRLLAAGAGRGAQLWNLTTRKLVTTLPSDNGFYDNAVAFSPDGKLLAASTGDEVEIWGGTDTIFTSLGVSTGDQTNSVAFGPGGTLLAVGTATVTGLADLTNSPMPPSLSNLPAENGGPTGSAAFSPDDTLIVANTNDGAQLWNVATHRLVATFPASEPANDASADAFSPDGKLLAIGTGSLYYGATQLRDVATGRLVATFPASAPVGSLAFSPDGKLLAIGAGNETQIWDVTTRKLVTTLPALVTPNSPDAMAFSPDGKLLATADASDGAQVWNLATRTIVTTLPVSIGNFPDSVAFSPDGKLLAAGTSNGTYLWDVATRKVVTTLAVGGPAYSMGFSPDGTILLIGTGTSEELWDVKTLQQFDTLHLPDATDFVMLSHNGALLATRAIGGSIELLNMPYLKNTISYLCKQAGESFPPAEWAKYAPGVPYMQTCP